MEVSVEFVGKLKQCYGKYDNWYPIAQQAAGAYAFMWNECYADGRMTEGEFAKLVSVELTIAYLRCHEIYGREVSKADVERVVLRQLRCEYGECEMVKDFEYRPWRFAA